MSKIDRLLIQGIRSFDPNASEVIKVFSPLTLIVGLNGSGKTTIIECLRYITTGELPPNSATGGAWLHDPKLCGENEILARVKMSFFDAQGQYIIVDRKLQLTVKKATRSQKTLDGTMQIKKKSGEEQTISSRVVELDQLIPQYLGVSKAILDSVIFCHQDESLWPMSAPTVLKKRFDEIFEAQKYTKAIDNIKVIRKRKMDELNMLKRDESHAEERKKNATKAEKKMEELYASIGDLTDKHKDIGLKIEEAIEKSKEAWNNASKFEQILSELQSKRIQEKSLTQSIESISKTLKRMDESDDELHRMQREHEDDVAKMHQHKDALGEQWTEANQHLGRQRDALGVKQTEVGMHRNAMQNYERQVDARTSLISEIAAKYQIRGLSVDASTDRAGDFKDKLARLVRQRQEEYDQSRKEIQLEVHEAQLILTTLSNQQSNHLQAKSAARSQLESIEKRIVELQRQASALDVNVGDQAVVQSRYEHAQREQKISKEEFLSADWDGQLSVAESGLSQLNDKKERLDTEQARAAQHAAELGQLNYLVSELADRRRFRDANVASSYEDFKSLFGGDWNIADLEAKFRITSDETNEAVKNAELQRDRVLHEADQKDSKLQEAQKDHIAKMKARDDMAATIKNTLDISPDQYPEELRQLEDSWETIKSDNTMFTAMKDYYKSCVEFATTRNECRLCERKLQNATEKSLVIQRMQAKLQKQLQGLDEQQTKDLEAELTSMRSQQTNYDAWHILTKELSELSSAIPALQEDRDMTNSKLEAADHGVREATRVQHQVQRMSKTVQNLVKCLQDITNLESQLEKVQQKSVGDVALRPTEVIQEDIRQINVEFRSATSALNTIRVGRERAHRQMTDSDLNVRDVQSHLTEMNHKIQQKSALEEQITDLRAQAEKIRAQIAQSDVDHKEILPQIAQAKDQLEDINKRGNEKESQLRRGLTALKDYEGKFERDSHDIDQFIDLGGPMLLAKSSREMEQLERSIKRLEENMASLGRQVKKAEEELRDHDDRERKIIDNLTFRADTKTLGDLKSQILQLEATNAAADRSRYASEGEKWHEIRNNLSAQQASYSGEIRTKDDQFKELEETWKQDYQNARAEYKKAHITTEVTKCAIEDLGRYAQALDKAVMKYHSAKMEEINRIIQELWRKTYRGTDVDTILIRSENESQKGNKSYNYRVVMVKQDAEMDMRGRCSAGQKVLASIIIRLALAECFSVNSGLIALDEPTTNLDRDNIRSLATSLHDLIKVRRQQANFQLIVITHDEEFLRYMNCADLCDEYFKVGRNDKQKSQIIKQSISEVYR